MRTHHKYVILGGGISGLIAHHYLKDEDCIIIEQDNVFGGATSRPSSLGGIRIIPDSEITRAFMKELLLPIYECRYSVGLFWLGQFHNLLGAARTFDLVTILNDYCRKTRRQSYYDIPDEEKDSIMSGIQVKMHKYQKDIPYLGGIDYVLNSLILEAQDKAFLGSEVERIENKAVITSNGAIIDFDYLITTIPLYIFLGMMGTPIQLDHVPIRFLNIKPEEPKGIYGMDNDLKYPAYIYFPGLGYPFHRMSFPRRINSIGGGINEILIETTEMDLKKNDKIWDTLEHIGLLNKDESVIVEEFQQDIGHFHYSEGGQALVKELEDFDVYCLGRYAEWNHNSNIETVISRIKEVMHDIRVANKPKTHA
jgi:hypothetical protein